MASQDGASPDSTPPSQWEIWGFMSLLVCPLGSAMPPHFSMPHAEHLEHDLLCHLFSNQRSYTLGIMFPVRGSAPARKTFAQWGSSLCQRPLPKSMHSADWWAITRASSRDLLTSQGHSRKEVKIGLVQLPPKAWKVVRILKDKIQSTPVLVFPDFDKPFLLETDASKEGLGAVLSLKQDDGCYHPVAFGSHFLRPLEKNYHSSKLEFLALKWSVTEHFKEYLAYTLFVVQTDNNPLTYILTTPNLDATGHRLVGMLASFKFTLEYQKGADNRVADALSWVPIHHDCQTV